MPFTVRFRDGRIELEPLAGPLEFVEHDGLLVVAAAEETPTLTEEAVGDVVATLRLERGR